MLWPDSIGRAAAGYGGSHYQVDISLSTVDVPKHRDSGTAHTPRSHIGHQPYYGRSTAELYRYLGTCSTGSSRLIGLKY